MPTQPTAQPLDAALAAAAEIASLAGRALLAERSSGLSGDSLKTAGDEVAQAVIAAELTERFPADAVLSEEAPDGVARLTNRRVWIVDPLDGTREFSEPPRDDWAVHIALVVDGELAGGVVALPARDLVCTSTIPPMRRDRSDGQVRVVVSRSRPSEHAQRLVELLGAELVPMGSAGAKAMAVVLGEADVYVHSGGQFEWDSAAPVAVAAAAGLHVSRLDGSPLRYNRPDPWLPDLLICRPDLAPRVIEICAGSSR